MHKTKRKLKTLSLKEKYELIKKVQNGEIKNKTKFAEDVGIKRTTLSFICAHSDKIIGDYEAGAITATRKEQEIGYDEAGETWKRLQTLCFVSPTVGFDECSQAYAQVDGLRNKHFGRNPRKLDDSLQRRP